MNEWLIVSGLLGLIVGIESVALFSIQKYSKVNQVKWLLLCMAIYGIAVPLILYRLLKYQGIGIVNFLWNIFSTITGFFIGIMMFQEKVNSLQWIGVAFGLLAFALIILGSQKQIKQA